MIMKKPVFNLPPNLLSEYLAVLKNAGISKFHCCEFEVEFPPELPKPEKVRELTAEEQKKQQYINENWSA